VKILEEISSKRKRQA